ncbi:Tfp pilus assembly protein PilF [Syntrophus gentianae]|uniref:Tfp pilus assembly protein PilF n=1 Tax=Syntrophus gentianae TaxID=43775 RepID=A0A1H7X743_9BACT|nr:tetratricopeptide repeat protein [Syntrophus gentianae]SEM29444.1 Tfp pilus assembly protein PilF [Syntrophus gentianae]
MNFSLESAEKLSFSRRCLFAAISLFLCLLLIYGNSFHGEWHFDDFDNIVANQNVHLSSLTSQEIQKTFYFRGEMSRPFSYLSFALNYFWGGTDVFGYHLVNFGIHGLTAFFLFLLIQRTLCLPLLSASYGKVSYDIALMASFLWAASPVQVPAVSMIVQRMASMAGLFYVLCLYFYLLGRTGNPDRKKVFYFVLSGFFALLSFGTKENTAILPAILFIYDLILIQGVNRQTLKKNLPFVVFPLVVLLVLSLFYLDFSSLMEGYRNRPFSLEERLLTEPRVLIFYLSLLFYPVNSRLALLHDFEISRSLFEPWTTFPAILAFILLNAVAFLLVRRKPLIAFCILFFFLNHLIEASIIPLELIFEHRNYVPSLFLFVPAALLISKVLETVSYPKILRLATVISFVWILILFGYTVFARNGVMARDVTLWLDNGLKYPHLSIVHVNIAKNYLDNGLPQEALGELHRALQENRYASTFQKALVHYNLGQMYNGDGQNKLALFYYERALSIYPFYGSAMSGIATVMLKEGNNEGALAYLKSALQGKGNHAGLYELTGIASLRLGLFREAEKAARTALSINPISLRSKMVLAECARRSGDLSEAISRWRALQKDVPSDVDVCLALIELYSETGQRALLVQEIAQLMELKGTEELNQFLQKSTQPTQELQIYAPNMNRILAIIEQCRKEESKPLKI